MIQWRSVINHKFYHCAHVRWLFSVIEATTKAVIVVIAAMLLKTHKASAR